MFDVTPMRSSVRAFEYITAQSIQALSLISPLSLIPPAFAPFQVDFVALYELKIPSLSSFFSVGLPLFLALLAWLLLDSLQ
jgi:hypothetical protein